MSKLTLPIFPLPNVVFFPKMILPLHVFEPRYKRMIRDTLRKERRIGINLLKEGWQEDYYGSPPIHTIGCMGEIEQYERLPEGRFNILLRGTNRFEILSYEKETPYRIASIRLLKDTPFGIERYDQIKERDVLFERFVRYFKTVLGMDIDEDRIDRKGSLESMVNQIASILDIPVREKQELLEASNLRQRFDLVKSIVETELNYADKLRRVVSNMKFAPNEPELN